MPWSHPTSDLVTTSSAVAELSTRDNRLLRARPGQQALALCLLARDFSSSAHGLALLSRLFLRRLLVRPPTLHLAKNAFALKLFLQSPQGLVDVVFTDENYQSGLLSLLAGWAMFASGDNPQIARFGTSPGGQAPTMTVWIRELRNVSKLRALRPGGRLLNKRRIAPCETRTAPVPSTYGRMRQIHSVQREYGARGSPPKAPPRPATPPWSAELVLRD